MCPTQVSEILILKIAVRNNYGLVYHYSKLDGGV